VKSRRGICIYEKLAPNKTPRRQNESEEASLTNYPTPSSNISRASDISGAIPGTFDTNASSASTLASRPLPRDTAVSDGRIMHPQEKTTFMGPKSINSLGTALNTSEEALKSNPSENCTIYKTRLYGQSHWMNSIKLVSSISTKCIPVYKWKTERTTVSRRLPGNRTTYPGRAIESFLWNPKM